MKNNFELIGYTFSLIVSDRFTATIITLAQECKIPVPQMRKLVYNLLGNKLLLTHLYPVSDDDTDEDPIAYAVQFIEQIRRGEADDIEITLSDIDDFINAESFDDFYLLPITASETEFIKEQLPDLLQSNRADLFKTKTIIDYVPPIVLQRRDQIQAAISACKKIEFRYDLHGEKKIVCCPVRIIQNLTTNLVYMKDIANNNYRLDRIRSDIRILPETYDINDWHPNPYLKYYWGIDSKEKAGDPIHIKIRISQEPANILEKIRNDIALRSETGRLYPGNNGYYYYEDDILGTQDFRKWLRGFGSAVMVLEPESIINEIVQSSESTLNYYNLTKDLTRLSLLPHVENDA